MCIYMLDCAAANYGSFMKLLAQQSYQRLLFAHETVCESESSMELVLFARPRDNMHLHFGLWRCGLWAFDKAVYEATLPAVSLCLGNGFGQ